MAVDEMAQCPIQYPDQLDSNPMANGPLLTLHDKHAENTVKSGPLLQSTDSSPQVTPKAFHRFQKLPLEVRLMIWEHARPFFARTLEVTFKSHWAEPQIEVDLQASAQLTLISIDSESRNELLKHYRHGLNPQYFPNPSLLFDFELDTLFINFPKLDVCLQSWTLRRMFSKTILRILFGASTSGTRKHLRHLAGNRRFWESINLKLWKPQSELPLLELDRLLWVSEQRSSPSKASGLQQILDREYEWKEYEAYVDRQGWLDVMDGITENEELVGPRVTMSFCERAKPGSCILELAKSSLKPRVSV